MPPPVHQLKIESAFNSLSDKEKLYAHYMSRAAWYGTKIILRQVSPESIGIFDLLLEIYAHFSGEWSKLAEECELSQADVDSFVDYSATFLSNVGNYYGSGDQKFVPTVEPDFFRKLGQKSSKLKELYEAVAVPMFSIPPFSLGFPGKMTQSMYYPAPLKISQEEISLVSKSLEERSIYPENTRIQKSVVSGVTIYEVLLASTEAAEDFVEFHLPSLDGYVRIIKGDHANELKLICSCLAEAAKNAANVTQKIFLAEYIESFQTGDLQAYRQSQRTWIKDKQPRIESIFGFVEPYRDPYGTRAEFEGLVAISDPNETKVLTALVDHSAKFIRRLPWIDGRSTENDGKGPFEKALFEPPDFSSVHALVYCSSIIFPGINLPNYNDIRQESGFKNVIVANRMSTESNQSEISPFIDSSEAERFHKHKFPAYYWWVVLHELLGHGTGKMMVEEADGKFNFDAENPPINPLTGRPISSWYLPGQTWTGQFGDLATTVDECRAELVGAYLMDDAELLALLGFNTDTKITAQDITYNLYLQLGIDGVRGLQNFNIDDAKWGQAHSRAHFAMLKCLLLNGNGFMSIDCDPTRESLIVRVDRSRIVTCGKPALGEMLLRLHMYRCIADADACRSYYENLSRVDGEYLEWRKIVIAKKQPKWVFVQANTFLHGEEVTLKEYEPTPRGVFQSWAERAI
ncbi:peptidase family M49-domain-containing protein [Calycina marina]|uniref:Dipeptidyl peptidase 3 n=1 Tax=Calycina marina TaxID=1763456 RepID=A0A9P7YZ53_9HELO|nr:peptidase family M49-domain-containing protein [Calycina marina]